ncbi:MAG: NosD domain-containing protein, partial [Thermoleophilia bacterium]
MKAKQHVYNDAIKAFLSLSVLVLVAILLNLAFAQNAKAATAKVISNNATGGDCATVGTWDPASLTCTLTSDINAAGMNGITISSDGVTLDGNGHAVNGSGGFTNGVQLSVRNNVTVKNLTVSNFNYGFYLTVSKNSKIFNNNVLGNAIPAYVSGGSGNVFSQPSPAGGNFWSNNTGCVDGNGDHICDAAFTFTGGSDPAAWTTASGWLVPPAPDVTAPTVASVAPAGIINTGATTVNIGYSDTESGVKLSSVVVNLDGAPLSGCTVTTTSASCPVSGLSVAAHTISGSVSDNANNVAPISGGFTVADNTAPAVTNIQPGGAINSTSTIVSASYSDDLSGINVATAAVQVDGAAVSGCTATATGISCTKAGLAEGSHTIAVSVADVSGNTGSGSGSFVVDVTAPAVSGILPSGTITTSSTTISAGLSDLGSGVNAATAAVTLDGAAVPGCSASATSVSCNVSALASGVHNIGVSVNDAAGNTGSGSGSFTVVAPDTTPPTVSNITPSGWINITNPTINADLADLGGSGVNAASAAIKLDGSATALTGCTATATHISCPTAGLAAGGHSIAVSVSDGAGNSGSGSASFSMDTTAPTVSAVAPAGTIYVNATSLSANFSDGGAGINSGSVVVSLDGTTVPGCTATAGNVNCPVSGIADGLHAISVTVNDNAGNTGSGSGSFTVNTTVSPSITTNTNYISNNSTGGSCTAIGVWNPATLTCTLTTDINVNSGKTGIEISNNGITIDGNGHKITSLGGFSSGVSVMIKSGVTVKNLTVQSFNYGVYLTSATNATVYNNNFIGNTNAASASGGSGNVFDQPMPAGGNYWSNHSTSAQGCDDLNADGRCDAPYAFTGGTDNNPWTTVNGWLTPPVPDITAPTVSSVAPSGIISSSSTTVSGSLFDGESGVKTASVIVTLDSSTMLGCTVTTTSFSCPATGLATGAHTIGGTVADNAGNVASISGSFTVVDTTAPVVSGLAPSGSVNSTSTTITANFSDDLSGINAGTAAATLDGGAVSGCTATATGINCAVSGLAQGNHNITVSVSDNSGNAGSASGSFNVDTVTPSITNILPTGTVTVSSPTISADYADLGSGIDAASASIHLDGAVLPLTGCTASAVHISCPATDLAPGAHTISVSVSDVAGNAATATGSFDYAAPDIAPPTISNVTPSGWINITNPTINADLADINSGVNAATATVSLDGGVALSGCTASATHISCPTTGLALGTHSISVRVADNAGNVGSGAGSFSIDAVNPTVSSLAPVGTQNINALTLSANYSDASAGINASSAVVTLDGTVVTGCSAGPAAVSCSVTGLTNASHTMVVSVADNAGNTGTASNTFVVDTTVSPTVTTNTNTISNNATGGACTTIGTWNPATLTCTLNTDINVNSGKNGIVVSNDGITIDGAGHKLTSLGGFASGVSLSIRNNITIKNLTIRQFNYGVYLLASSNNKIYNNSFISNTTQAYVSGGSSNAFSQPVPVAGNFWSNFSSPAQGCTDANADGYCDAAYSFTGGSDAKPWTYVDAWRSGDTTAPTISSVVPSGTINTGAAIIGASYSDSGSGINQGSVSLSLDGTALTGCTVTGTDISCPRTGLSLGAHSISGSVADAAGNVAPISGSFNIVDNTAPAVTGILPTGSITGTSTTISATMSDDLSGVNSATAAVYLDTVRVTGCAITASSVSCPVSGLGNGVHNITINVDDVSGNHGTGSGSFTVNNDIIPPSITNIQPSGWIGVDSTTISASYSDASGINTSSVVVTLDGTIMTGCTVNSSSVSCLASGLAVGSHSITVNVSDMAGNPGTGNGSFSIDKTGPAISNMQPASAVNSQYLTLSADISDAGSGVNSATAAVYLDSVKVTGCTTNASGISCANVAAAAGSHSMMVMVDDNVGNHGSNTATITVDITTPVVSSISPSGSITSASPIISANYSDVGSGINTAAVSVSLDGGTLTGCITGPNNVSCPVTALAQGSHSVSVSIQDIAGNSATGASTFSIDSIAPAVSNVQPSGWQNSTSATLSAYLSDSGSGINSATAAVYLDGVTAAGCTASSTSVSCPATLLAQGSHSILVKIKDNAGNIGSASGTFSVDTIAPVVSGITPTGTITSASATVYAYMQDAGSGLNGSTAAVMLDGTALTGCAVGANSVSCSVTGLANGAHTVSVSVQDNVGNTGTGTGAFSVNAAGGTPPAVTNLLPAGTINTTSATVSADYSSTGSAIDSATAQVYMDSGILAGCTATATHIDCPVTGLAQGHHTFTASVKNTLG